jgi:hypothetical protein
VRGGSVAGNHEEAVRAERSDSPRRRWENAWEFITAKNAKNAKRKGRIIDGRFRRSTCALASDRIGSRELAATVELVIIRPLDELDRVMLCRTVRTDAAL